MTVHSILLQVIVLVLRIMQSVELVGEKAFQACKSYGENMLECQNILHPYTRIRVPIDLLLYPHMVLLGYKNEEQTEPAWKCGGTLISENWVMTAAHCSEDPDSGPPYIMNIGTATFEFDEVDDLAQERLIAEFIVHPEFKPPSKYHDIALAKSDKPFVLNRDIRIACLKLDDDIRNDSLTATGFGSTISGAQYGSKTLMKVDVQIVDNVLCNRTMQFMIKRKILAHGITEDQLCAGDYAKGGKDTCRGDSGGPLQVMVGNVDCVKSFPLHTVVGITSFGRDCGRKMSPGVYTKVSKYIEWIESIVWP